MFTVDVLPIETTTTITSDMPDPSVVGQSVLVTFDVSVALGDSPTGTVTVGDGTAQCTAPVGAGGCTLTFPTAGAKTLTAAYSGDGTFASSTSTGAPHQVDLAATVAAITAHTPDPSQVGEAVTVTFSVAAVAPGSGSPTGTVTVGDGIATCSAAASAGSCTLSFASPGPKTLTATYAGNANFLPSVSSDANHVVLLIETTTTITSDTPDPSVVGQPVPMTFDVSVAIGDSPTGNVTVGDGTVQCTVPVGAGGCTLTFLTAGVRTLTAVYSGDATFASSTSGGAQHQVNPAATGLTITAHSPDPSQVGEAVTVEWALAFVPGIGSPTGIVTAGDGIATCSAAASAGSCTLSFAIPGTKTLTATFLGNADFLSSVSLPVSHDVLLIQTTTTITSDTPDPSVVGQPVLVTFVPETLDGVALPGQTVTVSDGIGQACSDTTDTDGAGGCTLTFLTAGAKTLTAMFAGNATFASSTSTGAPHQVNPATTTPEEDIVAVLADVGDLVSSGTLSKGQGNGLTAKLKAAQKEPTEPSGVNQLKAFINQVNGLTPKKLTEAEAQLLINAAQEVISKIAP